MEFYVLNPKESVNAELQRQDFQIKPEWNARYRISGPPGTAHQNEEFPTLRHLRSVRKNWSLPNCERVLEPAPRS